MRKNIVLLITIFFLSITYRFLYVDSPFWVDEFSSAIQARTILKFGYNFPFQMEEYVEPNNLISHLLIAASFNFLDVGEWQARLPFVIIGSFVPIVIYLVANKLFDKKVALLSSLIYTFSYLQISWARQARGYVLQQLIILVTLYLYKKILDNFSKTKLFLLLLISILGLLTHTTYILVIFSFVLHFIFFNRKVVSKFIFNFIFLLISILLIAVITFTGQLETINSNLKNMIVSHPNNLAYYHSFLWREQTVITLLSFIGVLLMLFKEKKYSLTYLLLLPIGSYLFFVSFMFAPYVSRYLLPIFPLLIIFVGVTISKLGEFISKKYSLAFSLLITFFIIANGDKFVLKPKAFYSVNHDMREVALINYDQVYKLIMEKGELEKNQTAVIDTWSDRMRWYLGDIEEYMYSFRWLNEKGNINGLPKSSPYKISEKGEKYIGIPPVKLIGELSDLKMAMDKYPKGFIWIDDTSLPADVIKYAKENFKVELYLDHYPLDDNPYSIWPGTLYSWGFEE